MLRIKDLSREQYIDVSQEIAGFGFDIRELEYYLESNKKSLIDFVFWVNGW